LRIDAGHLEQLAQEQRPFGAKEAAEWQRTMQLSNHETAALLGVAVSTWNAYKSQGNIPSAVAMLCRAARRDPILMQAPGHRPAAQDRVGEHPCRIYYHARSGSAAC